MLEVQVTIVELGRVPEIFNEGTLWMDDLFSFRQQHDTHEKHLEKPSLKDLKNKVTNDKIYVFHASSMIINRKHELINKSGQQYQL